MDINQLKYFSPYSCYINLTSKCNLRCKHCFGSYSIPIENELNLNEWKRVIDELYNSKVFFVNISGGEPTQSPHFKEFIEYLSKKGIHFILTTNGIFSKDMRDFIVNHKEYLIGIKISLDGSDKESYGFLRLDSNYEYNPKLFDIVLNNIFYFKEHSLPLTIASVLHKKNINKIDNLIELIKKINPISWFVSPIVLVGRGMDNKNTVEFYEFYNLDFWENLKKEGEKNKINIRLIDLPVQTGNQGLSSYECAGALNFCEINSDGTISPCPLCRVCIPKEEIKFDNIKEKSLLEIWGGDSFNKFRSYMNIGCGGCKMLPKCNKCIAQSFRYFGDGSSPTPFCIKNGQKMGLKKYDFYRTTLKNKFNLEV
ncbi:MAG: radical SAM protein [Nanoarchaeota archaeon]|nr:radical SAM protein [Nanoarchaeota archaeon]